MHNVLTRLCLSDSVSKGYVCATGVVHQSNKQGGTYECTAATLLPARACLSLPVTQMMAVIKAQSHREMGIAPCPLRLELAIREQSLTMPK